ncbi:MAG: tol-pal system protein YbgF [Thiohalophilus sp.]|uniref:tol-pal system protein YbgF n=1 Tax=Thiohalophilus sp. TaxID=3028392 RepID=UPI00286FCC19|nr:tol-pal system protein YbgF [Thiohalophilus sp.]MDR9437267.1 tol-pal system protein YbgF [Thiohalophilus sp.]
MVCRLSRTLIVFLALALPAPWLAAQDTPSTDQRLERLERLVDSQGLADILMRLNSLEAEVRELRGLSEEQAHTIEDLKKRQRELYIDLDRRLLQLERAGIKTQDAQSPGQEPSASTSGRRTAGKPTASGSVTPQERQSEPPSQTVPLSVNKSEQEAYQEAFNLLRELEYDKAIDAFDQFLQNYPDGRYAHIARYWLGEANYARRNYKQAIVHYQNLIERYPDSPKVAEAMLKIGYSHNQLEAYKAARDVLEKLIASHPGTTEASQARNLLQKIRAKLSDG